MRLPQQQPHISPRKWRIAAPTSTPPQRCRGSGRCRPPGSQKPSQGARSYGSRRWGGCASPSSRCGCCPTPWWTSVLSGGCRRTLRNTAEAERWGWGGGMHLLDGGGMEAAALETLWPRVLLCLDRWACWLTQGTPLPITTPSQAAAGARGSEDLLLAAMASQAADCGPATGGGSSAADPGLWALGGGSLRDRRYDLNPNPHLPLPLSGVSASSLETRRGHHHPPCRCTVSPTSHPQSRGFEVTHPPLPQEPAPQNVDGRWRALVAVRGTARQASGTGHRTEILGRLVTHTPSGLVSPNPAALG